MMCREMAYTNMHACTLQLRTSDHSVGAPRAKGSPPLHAAGGGPAGAAGDFERRGGERGRRLAAPVRVDEPLARRAARPAVLRAPRADRQGVLAVRDERRVPRVALGRAARDEGEAAER